jgi:phage shock protein E
MKRPDIWNSATIKPLKLVGIALVASAITVSGCASSNTAEPVVGAESTAVAEPGSGSATGSTGVISELVTGQRGKELVDQGAVVIDVRTPAEFAEGHVPNALLIDVSASSFASQISQLDPNQAYVVYCRSGNRSAVAISQMLAAGFTELYDMGPLTAWAQAGHPVVTN